MSTYFQNARTSEVSELQNNLNSLKPEVMREAVKQVIASMTYGKDMSVLFPHVVKCMETTSIELKKLVYLYIINYARSKADMTIMAINTFRKDAHEQASPLLRALAIRTMGCIRIEKITEYLCESLKDTLSDRNDYVRKTAAMCVSKLFVTNPRLVKDNGFIKILQDLVSDNNANVVANAIVGLLEISDLTGKNYVRFNSSSIKKLLYALNECTEWGQIYILEGVAKYKPIDSAEAEMMIEQVIPRLSHVNPAVVLAAVKVMLKLLDSITSEDNIKKINKRLAKPLVTLLSNTSEIQYVVLRNINFIVEKCRGIFEEPSVFFVKNIDPIFVKLEKLEILKKIVSKSNFEVILTELHEYANWLELEFTRKSIKVIGQIGIKVEKATKRALAIILEILKAGNDYVIEEGTTALSEILRHYPSVMTDTFLKEAITKIKNVTEPEAKAGFAWILGQYNDRIEDAGELIKELSDECLDEPPMVQLEILLCAVKYYVTYEEEGIDSFIIKLLKKVGEESDNPDIRDRAYIYWRLLSTDAQRATDILYQEKSIHVAEEDLITVYNEDFLDFLVNNMATTVSVYHKEMQEYIPENLLPKKIELSDDEGEIQEEKKKEETPQRRKKKKRREEVEEEEEESKHKKSRKHKDESPSKPTGGIDLLDLGDDILNDLSISSSDIDFLSAGGRDYIVEVPEMNLKGLRISAAFIREQSEIKLRLVVINNSSSDLNDITFNFAKNSFGLAPKSWNCTEIPKSSKRSIEIVCNFSEANLNQKEPPSCPFNIKIKLASKNEQFIFEVQCMLHVLLKENGTVSKEDFKNMWQSLGKHLEHILEIRNLKPACRTAEGLEQWLKTFNIGVTTKVKKKESTQVMLYCSCQTVNSLPIVMEIGILSGGEGNTARLLIKTSVLSIGSLAAESFKFIMDEKTAPKAELPFLFPND